MDHATPAAVILSIILLAPIFYYILKAQSGLKIPIRRIPGIDAINEAIGRTVELGRPISFTTGLTGVNALLYACLGTLKYVARKAAMFSSKFFVPCSDPEALVLTEVTTQSAYRAEKKFALYNPESIRFLSEDQFAYAAGYMGLVHRENVGAAFLFGSFAAESLILAEAGQQIGAFQVAATTSPPQVPFFITACDYTLIGEELYAAGAYLSEDPVQTGSLKGQDIAKAILLSTVILGSLIATFFPTTTSTGENDNHLKRWLETPWTTDSADKENPKGDGN
jgi:hypothetical protein